MDNYIHPTLYNGWNYLSMLGLKSENRNYWIATPQLHWCNRWSPGMDTLFLTKLYSACNHLPLSLIHVSCFNNYSFHFAFLPRRNHVYIHGPHHGYITVACISFSRHDPVIKPNDISRVFNCSSIKWPLEYRRGVMFSCQISVSINQRFIFSDFCGCEGS